MEYCKHYRRFECKECWLAAGIAPDGKSMADPVYLEVIRMVRADPQIGKGTCTVTDECRTDNEIYEELMDYGSVGRCGLIGADELFKQFKEVELAVDRVDQERWAEAEHMRKGEF